MLIVFYENYQLTGVKKFQCLNILKAKSFHNQCFCLCLGEELELLNFDLSQNNSVDNYIDARDDEAEVMMNERNDSEEEIPNHYQNEEENVVEQNNVPQAFRWREQVLHFFHRRHPFRGRFEYVLSVVTFYLFTYKKIDKSS